ncbi:MAG: Rpn family recombination-promoting nuclease/putative transposase [Magnetococcales bacterium]|nr:Rpn family recombination-promoting nuclease/putative transposase [Magnetococcales bacterium]
MSQPGSHHREEDTPLVDLSQPHDRLVKHLLSHPGTADAFFRERLPEPVVARLAPDPPEPLEGSFVPDALSSFVSDRLFRMRLIHGPPLYIHLLIEHKSYPDRKVAWQMARGIMAASEQFIRETGREWERVPAVLPVLVYHGASPWTHPHDLVSLMDADPELWPWLMNFRFVLVDLSATADPFLSRHARLRAGFLALKYGTRSPREQMEALDQMVDALQGAPELLVPVMIYLMATFSFMRHETVHEIVMRVKPKEEAEMMSIYARELIAKGRAEGEEIGKTLGERNRAVSMLLRLIKRKFGVDAAEVRGRVEAADLDTLDLWADRILDAGTLDEVFGEQALAS